MDPRFRVTRGELLSALRRAEAVWEDAIGIDLFRYSEDGPLVVHLLYDDRQKTAQDNERLTDDIERIADRVVKARATYDRTKAQYETKRRAHEAALAAHEARLAAYNRRVETWNARGGGSAAEQDHLRREEDAVGASAVAGEKSRLEVNALAEKANQLSKRVNEMADEVNANVDVVNASAGREFKQGRYVRDQSGQRIEVFEFLGTVDLVHLLAHEMGHALDLQHNEQPQSIMYGSNTTQTLRPTAEDLAPLRAKCGLPIAGGPAKR